MEGGLKSLRPRRRLRHSPAAIAPPVIWPPLPPRKTRANRPRLPTTTGQPPPSSLAMEARLSRLSLASGESAPLKTPIPSPVQPQSDTGQRPTKSARGPLLLNSTKPRSDRSRRTPLITTGLTRRRKGAKVLPPSTAPIWPVLGNGVEPQKWPPQ